MSIPWNEYPWCRHHGIAMGFPWVFAHMKSPWIVHGIPVECTPWVFHGQAMVISYGQKPMENSWNISMTFPWGISIRVPLPEEVKSLTDRQADRNVNIVCQLPMHNK